MIVWPKKKMPPIVEKNIERLRASGAALQLEDDPRTFAFENFAWTDHYPLRFILREQRESGRRMAIELENETLWRSSEEIEASHRAPGSVRPA